MGDGVDVTTLPKMRIPARQFRALQGRNVNDLVLLQCCITLLKSLKENDGLIQIAFNMYVMDEIAEIGLCCTDKTAVVTYSLWIFDIIVSHVTTQRSVTDSLELDFSVSFGLNVFANEMFRHYQN